MFTYSVLVLDSFLYRCHVVSSFIVKSLHALVLLYIQLLSVYFDYGLPLFVVARLCFRVLNSAMDFNYDSKKKFFFKKQLMLSLHTCVLPVAACNGNVLLLILVILIIIFIFIKILFNYLGQFYNIMPFSFVLVIDLNPSFYFSESLLMRKE